MSFYVATRLDGDLYRFGLILEGVSGNPDRLILAGRSPVYAKASAPGAEWPLRLWEVEGDVQPRQVTGATNTTPIRITVTAHGLSTGAQVRIAGVGGNTAANGIWIVTRIDADTFSLDGSAGSGGYSSGGRMTLLSSDEPGSVPLDTFTVLGELDAAETLGPNGSRAAAVLNTAHAANVVQVHDLEDAWFASGRAARARMRYQPTYEVAKSDRRGFAQTTARYGLASATGVIGRSAVAMHTAVCAACAVVVEDLLSASSLPDDFYDVLTGPWSTVFGAP